MLLLAAFCDAHSARQTAVVDSRTVEKTPLAGRTLKLQQLRGVPGYGGKIEPSGLTH